MWKIIPFLKTKSLLFPISLSLALLCSCGKTATIEIHQEKGEQVARVGESVLYEQLLEEVVSREKGLDSIALRERFINNWIRKELLLQKARLNLSEEEQDVEDLVDDYRSSLLINQYKQKYLAEHLDTLVTEEDISLYVEQYPNNFVLQEPLFQYYVAKILTKNKEDIQFIKTLFDKKEINLMQDFDLKSSTVIESNNFGWFTMRELLASLPKGLTNKDLKKLRIGDTYTYKDSIATYLLRPLEIVKEGEMSPQQYINEKVREIILHNRKIALAKQLEYEIYEDAKTKNQFEVN